jgi:hypothetical protein
LAALALLLLCSPLAAGGARAEHGPLGVGLTIGSPTGFNAKIYLSEQNAFDLGVGAAPIGERGVSLHFDYLWHPSLITEQPAFNMPWYLGVGGRVLWHSNSSVGNDTHLGVRVPFGFLFDFKKLPMDAFLEAALIIDFIQDEPAGDKRIVDVNAALGVRYYF